MEVLRLRDVPLNPARGDREVNRAAFEDYMRCLGIELVWVKRDKRVGKDGSRQCVVCLEHKTAKEYSIKSSATRSSTSCWDCRKRYGYGSSHNRGASKDGGAQ